MSIRRAIEPLGGLPIIKKGTIFFESNNPQSSQVSLPKGLYDIVVVGGGGSGAALYDYNSNWWGGGSGASGACVRGQLRITVKSLSVSIVVGQGGTGANGKGVGGQTGDTSKITAGSIIATPNGGGGGYCANWGTAIGGTASQSGLLNPILTNGNNGLPGAKGSALMAGATSVYGGHGAGSNSGGSSYQTSTGGKGYVKITYVGKA